MKLKQFIRAIVILSVTIDGLFVISQSAKFIDGKETLLSPASAENLEYKMAFSTPFQIPRVQERTTLVRLLFIVFKCNV